MMDQTDRVIYDLKNNPYSRRIMTNIYVHQDLHEMHLYPCAYSMTFNVTKEADSDVLTLNGILNQRSQDVLAANNWNVCQVCGAAPYMLAQVCGHEGGRAGPCDRGRAYLRPSYPDGGGADRKRTLSGAGIPAESGDQGLLRLYAGRCCDWMTTRHIRR